MVLKMHHFSFTVDKKLIKKNLDPFFVARICFLRSIKLFMNSGQQTKTLRKKKITLFPCVQTLGSACSMAKAVHDRSSHVRYDKEAQSVATAHDTLTRNTTATTNERNISTAAGYEIQTCWYSWCERCQVVIYIP